MTTREAAQAYAVEHVLRWAGRPLAVYNPKNVPVEDLPVIYGFNNGGSGPFLNAVLLAEDGEHMGGHACSDECYMPSDLGCLEGSRPDRHKRFRKKYLDGYRMEFVSAADVKENVGLMQAYSRNQDRREERELR